MAEFPAREYDCSYYITPCPPNVHQIQPLSLSFSSTKELNPCSPWVQMGASWVHPWVQGKRKRYRKSPAATLLTVSQEATGLFYPAHPEGDRFRQRQPLRKAYESERRPRSDRRIPARGDLSEGGFCCLGITACLGKIAPDGVHHLFVFEVCLNFVHIHGASGKDPLD